MSADYSTNAMIGEINECSREMRAWRVLLDCGGRREGGREGRHASIAQVEVKRRNSGLRRENAGHRLFNRRPVGFDVLCISDHNRAIRRRQQCQAAADRLTGSKIAF